MKKIIIYTCALLPLLACSEEKPNTQEKTECCAATQACPEAKATAETAKCPVSQETAEAPKCPHALPTSKATPMDASMFHHMGSTLPEGELYDFSCMEMLRITIVEQAEAEGLPKQVVTDGIDALATKLIEDNLEALSKIDNEADADIAMMKLFKERMGKKTLSEILELK